MELRTMGTCILVGTLVLCSKTPSANSSTCNVGRGNKPPLYARSCDETEYGNYIITPCSPDLPMCRAESNSIYPSKGCDQKSPSTPTPQNAIEKYLKRYSEKAGVKILAFDSSMKKQEFRLQEGVTYLASFPKGAVSAEAISDAFVSSKGKKLINKQDARLNEIVGAKLGWKPIKIVKGEVVPLDVANLLPSCNPTSTNNQPLVQPSENTSKKDTKK